MEGGKEHMGETSKLESSGVFRLDDIIVESYVPEEIQNNGVCLALGLMFALYGNHPYQFEFLMLRHSGKQIFAEPLIYKDPRRLVMKEICFDIQKHMRGDLGSVYVQMKERESGVSIGGSFWNLNRGFRSFSVAYRACKADRTDINTKRLGEFVSQVYYAFLNNYDTVMQKLEISVDKEII